MANKLMFLLHLALVCSLAFVFVSSASVGGKYVFVQEDDAPDENTGENVHDRMEVDSHCAFLSNTNTMADSSKTEILDYFADGKSVMLASNSSQECWVRDIPEDEKAEAGTCVDGAVEKYEEKPDAKELNYTKSDEKMSEEEKKQLPAAIQAICAGKDIYKLLPHTNGNVENGVTETRAKRSPRVCWRLYTVYRYRYTRCYRVFFKIFCRRYYSVMRYLRYYWC